jgi:hypothetical protein
VDNLKAELAEFLISSDWQTTENYSRGKIILPSIWVLLDLLG